MTLTLTLDRVEVTLVRIGGRGLPTHEIRWKSEKNFLWTYGYGRTDTPEFQSTSSSASDDLKIGSVCLCHGQYAIGDRRYFLAPCDMRKHTHQQAARHASTDSAWRHPVWLSHSNIGFQRPVGRRSYHNKPRLTRHNRAKHDCGLCIHLTSLPYSACVAAKCASISDTSHDD